MSHDENYKLPEQTSPEVPRKGSWKRITTGSNYTPPKKKRKKHKR